jgi:hypothetical protein
LSGCRARWAGLVAAIRLARLYPLQTTSSGLPHLSGAFACRRSEFELISIAVHQAISHLDATIA